MLDIVPLPDISAASPAGENLELDGSFGELERAARGKPEAQYGKTIIPAEPPNWKETQALANSILQQTRDLRVLAHLAVARLHLAGFVGFAEVLGQIRDQVENHWEHVHPQLDPEDDNDPILRANALLRLQDAAHVQRPMRDLPLASTPQTGPISWRDIAIFRGVLPPEPEKTKPTEALIRGVFKNTDAGRLDALREAIDFATEASAAIPAAFEAHAGPATGPDLTALRKLLLDIQKELRNFAPAAVVAEAPAEPEPAAEEVAQPGPESPQTPGETVRGAMSVRSLTAVRTRDDALFLLDLVTTYFRTYEPTNPAPLLIARARRMASMDFMEILRELAPDAMHQAQTVTGPQSE